MQKLIDNFYTNQIVIHFNVGVSILAMQSLSDCELDGIYL